MTTRPTVLITGASTGIGAVYADRFARRGHDLVLVARDHVRLEALAAKLRGEHNVAVEVLQADLTQLSDLQIVEARLRDDARINILVNNAGAAQSGAFIEQSTDSVAQLIALNTTALVRLASAIAPRLSKAGDGAIINIGSVVGLAPEFGMTVYGHQGVCAVPVTRPEPGTVASGRLCASSPAGLHPHGDLGSRRYRHQHLERHHGGGRSGRRRADWLRPSRAGDHSCAAGSRALGCPANCASGSFVAAQAVRRG